jgi:hypothetical protein
MGRKEEKMTPNKKNMLITRLTAFPVFSVPSGDRPSVTPTGNNRNFGFCAVPAHSQWNKALIEEAA